MEMPQPDLKLLILLSLPSLCWGYKSARPGRPFSKLVSSPRENGGGDPFPPASPKPKESISRSLRKAKSGCFGFRCALILEYITLWVPTVAVLLSVSSRILRGQQHDKLKTNVWMP